MEQWKEYNKNYLISNTGKVISRTTGKLKATKEHNGYLYISYSLDGTNKMKTIHRMVAETFIPNPNNLREVDHKNCDKHDNRVENLEWVSSSENKLRAIKNGIWGKNQAKWFGDRKAIIAVDLDTKQQERFISINQAERKYGKHIIDVLKGRRKKTHNHYFYYEGGDDLATSNNT